MTTQKRFRICYTSDMHGYVFPTDYLDRQDKPVGIAKLAQAFNKDEETLVIDGGDILQGSPLTTLSRKLSPDSNALAEALNLAGYDYVGLGNHDFNYGLAKLESHLSALRMPCLCCNIRDKAGRLPLLPYAIHTLPNGLKLGLVGAVTHHVSRWEPAETVALLDITPPLEPVRQALDTVRPHCDVTILIYHGGIERDLETAAPLTKNDENEAWKLAETLDVDIILTGHQHQRVSDLRVAGTLLVQPGCNAQGYIELMGLVDTDAHGRRRLELSASFKPPAPTPKPTIIRALQPLEDRVQQALDEPLATLDRALPAQPALERAILGSPIANFINQIQRLSADVDISACAIAADSLSLPRQLTVREVLIAYPYANTLYVVEMTGQLLKAYMEKVASYFEVTPPGDPGASVPATQSPLAGEGVLPGELRPDGLTLQLAGHTIGISQPFMKPKVAHYNYDFFSGLQYAFDLSRPPFDRVRDVLIDGEPLKVDKRYTLCVNSYRQAGSGGYEFLSAATPVREIQRDVATLIIEHLLANPEVVVDSRRFLTVLLPK